MTPNSTRPSLRVPVPVGGVGVGLDAVAADVEPDRRVEGGVLVQQEVDELVVEDGGVFGGAEVAVRRCPSRGWFRRRG